MNRTNQILSVVLIAQLILVGAVFFRGGEEAGISTGPLLPAFNAEAVTKLVLRDSEGQELILAQENGAWTLPEAGDYPVDISKVTPLLDKIAALQANRVIAESSSSHRRLGVSEDAYQARVEIEQGNVKNVLYIGTSAGANATHMRVDGSDRVYLAGGLTSWDATPRVSMWIDTLYLSVPMDNVVGLTLENENGVFRFEKDTEGIWSMPELADGEFDSATFTTLLNQATSIRMTEPLGVEELPEYGLSAPLATITLVTREAISAEETDEASMMSVTYTLKIGAKVEESSAYAISASTSDYYVLLSSYTAENFINKTVENFRIIPEESALPEPGSP